MKYFGIGISRTGTSTLADAFKILGLNTKHYMTSSSYMRFIHDREDYDFVNDMPIYWSYRELDTVFPKSKFIYTERNIDDWTSSCKKYFSNNTRNNTNKEFQFMWKSFFKSESIQDVDYTEIYNNHRHKVMEYFNDRPDDLLVINIPDGDGWDKLCTFIDYPIPNVPFPHTNKFVD